jgi:hypothetical protein
MRKKVSKSEIDIEKMVVEAILVKREIRYYDIRVKLGNETYIVPVCEDSDNKKTNFDFRNLPDITDEDCGIAMEIIEAQIDQMPPLTECNHVKDDEDAEADFYRGTTTGSKKADEFFDDAIKEYHEFCEDHPITFLNNSLNDADEIEEHQDYQSYVLSRKEPYRLDYFQWEHVRRIIDGLPASARIFYQSFYDSPEHTHEEWQLCFDYLIKELTRELK